MKTFPRLIVCSLLLAGSPVMAQFTPGRVVVLRCVDSSAGGAGTLVEYNRGGVSSFQVALPADSNTNPATSIVFGNNSPLNHNISLSGDGAFVVLPGYAVVTPSVDSANSSTNSPRVVATVKYNGSYARAPFSYSGGAIVSQFRSATSDGFGNFWGNGSDSVKYLNTMAPVGSGAARAVAVINGNIYETKAPSLNFGLYQITGLPTSLSSETKVIDSSLMGGTTPTPGGFAIPAAQTPWQELHRAITGQYPGGAVIEAAVPYQRIAQTRGLPRDNH